MESVPGMAGSSLQVIPLEVRFKIYKEVLTAPYRVIYLTRISSDGSCYKIGKEGPNGFEKVRLSFLRTCKEIYEECKDKLWL
jgi:hypothetical protein